MSVGVRIERVDLSYGANHVLKAIDLEIQPGELFAFLGPSGCGKTTLLRLIAGFNQADSGRVLIGEADVSRLPPWKRDVGLVFQNYALWPHMTVFRNIAFGLEERRVPRREIPDRVNEALRLVGLSAFAERRPSQLSGGQQQRVALARTIVVRPKVLLLDEPLSNLDAKLRVQVRRELRDLQQSLGLTTIFVTHDQEEANAICDRIAVMNDGKIQQVGKPEELYSRPANLFVAGFLGAANILPGSMAGGESGELPVAFRPQDARIVLSGTPSGAQTLNLAGELVRREFLGAFVRYGVRVGRSEVNVDAPFQAGEALIERGAAVTIQLDPKKLMALTN